MRRLRSRHIRDEWFMVRNEVWGRTARAVASHGPRTQKSGNLVRLRLPAIRSIRVTRFDESSSAAAAITSSSWWSVERLTPRRPV